MWSRRFLLRGSTAFTQATKVQFRGQYSRFTNNNGSKLATPLTLGFLGFLFGSGVDYDAVRYFNNNKKIVPFYFFTFLTVNANLRIFFSLLFFFRNEIANSLDDYDWDDGSWGPVLIRLAWHASGTYQKSDNSGGSDGSTMRYKHELSDGANAGLEHAQKKLQGIKEKYPKLSYADLWILASYVAIEEMGGPRIEFKGRHLCFICFFQVYIFFYVFSFVFKYKYMCFFFCEVYIFLYFFSRFVNVVFLYFVLSLFFGAFFISLFLVYLFL